MSGKPKFSIVLICRNEAKMIPRMFASLKEFVARGGDVNIVDTGSTDGSPDVARSLGIRVKEVGEIYRHTIDEDLAKQINDRFTVGSEFPVVKPGETYFDFSSARNAAAAMGDCDHVCTMDCDEMMTNLNIDVIDQLIESDPLLAHFEYNFIFSHDQFGNPLVKFIQSKFYNRKRMEWRGIIHELVTPTVGGNRYYLQESDFLLEHFQNPETDRSQYLRGLAVDCFSHPNSDRNSHYFARELWWTGRPFSAAKEFKRHVEMNRWPAERAESLLFLADIAGAMGGEDLPIPPTLLTTPWPFFPQLNPDMSREELKTLQIHFCNLALQVEPMRREPLIKLAQIYERRGQHQAAIYYATASLELPWYPFYGANEAFYKNEPHEIIYRCAGWSGDIAKAQKHLLKCLEYQPKHPDYLRDTKFYWEYGDNGIDGWMEFPALTFLYDIAKRMETIVEVGAWKGKSTHALASGLKASDIDDSRNAPVKQMISVDHWQGSQDPKDLTNEIAKYEDVFAVWQKNIKGLTRYISHIRKGSLEAAAAFVGHVDMVFIDAGHTYEEVVADIRAWKPKARILLCGHDYWPEIWPGVVQAVNEELGGPDEVHGTLWVKWLNTPKVSICVPTLGRPEKLQRLLKAIKENAGYKNYEVIVKADQLPPNNVGAPTMLARCVEESTGDLVMFLGNDCIPEPNFLQEAVWSMIRHFPDLDGMIGLNDGYWDGNKGHVATHWLASKKLLPYLEGEFFHTGYYHTGCDNELLARVEMIDKYRWEPKAKIFHDHPINQSFSWSDPLYEQSYAGPRHDADDALYAQRAEKYGFANRKWS